jgi:hypothetical protein
VKKHQLIAILLVAGAVRPAIAQVDLAGDWRAVQHEDTFRRGGVLIGEYVGLPLTPGARLRAESWTGSLLTVPEHQCIPHPVTYAEHSYAMNQMRIWNVVDPETSRIVAIRKRGTWMEPERTIWLDGRPHPPASAPHTWQGFSTGRWDGHMLTVSTTHIKSGHIQMNGVTLSDEVTMTEHFVRRGNYLTNITILDDPVYLTESFIRSSTWTLDPTLEFVRYPCGPNEIVVEIPRPPGTVPHVLPGANDQLMDFAAHYGLPLEAALGGAETMYPEYVEKMKSMKPAAAPKKAPATR